tara:strand:+ start:150 stop:395 length:246 start_codon:yes stop_codon:yes gene_type:complete
MSNMTFADDFEEWSTELKSTGNGIKRYEIPLEGKVVVLAVDMLDAMKALENKLSVVPSHQFNLKPKLGQVEITDLVGYEEE